MITYSYKTERDTHFKKTNERQFFFNEVTWKTTHNAIHILQGRCRGTSRIKNSSERLSHLDTNVQDSQELNKKCKHRFGLGSASKHL